MDDLKKRYIKVLKILEKEIIRIGKEDLKGIEGADKAISSLVELDYRILKVIEAVKNHKEDEKKPTL